MSGDTSVESDRAQVVESDTSGNQERSDVTVEHDPKELTKKLVDLSAENKKFRQKASKVTDENENLRKQIEAMKTAQMQEQGKYKEMYESTQQKLQALEETTKKKEAALAYRAVTDQFKASAMREGCGNVEDLIKLATADGLISELEVSQEDYSVTPESLKTALEKSRQRYAYLYGRPTPAVRDGIPTSKTQTKPASTNLATKTMDELIALAKQV